jgi:hypothetical protein
VHPGAVNNARLTVKPMRKPQKKTEEQHTLVGTWFNGDEYETEVE